MFPISLLCISLFLPVVTGIIILLSKGTEEHIIKNSKIVASFSAFINLIFSIYFSFKINSISSGYQLVMNYIIYNPLHFNFSIGIDNISLLFLLLTNLIFFIAFMFSYVKKYNRYFFIILLLLQFSVIGTFLATNMFLFYVFFELSVFIIFFAMGRNDKNIYAQYKFLLFNVLGSLLMFIAFIYISYINQSANFSDLFNSNIDSNMQNTLWFVLFLAFAIKSGLFPFHLWVSDTYSNSSNIVIMLLSGILIKFGIYGFIRILLPAFPLATIKFGEIASILSLITALFCMIVAFTKDNIRSFIAYFSLGHIGIIVFGIFSLTIQSIQGAILQAINHSIFTIGLLLIFIFIEKRVKINKFYEISGLINKMPLLSIFFMIVILAGLSIPVTNTFIGEFLILQGSFNYSPMLTILATFSVVLSAVVMLTMYRKINYGSPSSNIIGVYDITLIEIIFAVIIFVLIIFIGIYPQMLLDLINPFASKLVESIRAQGIINNIF